MALWALSCRPAPRPLPAAQPLRSHQTHGLGHLGDRGVYGGWLSVRTGVADAVGVRRMCRVCRVCREVLGRSRRTPTSRRQRAGGRTIPLATMGYPFESGSLGRCRRPVETIRAPTRTCCRGSLTSSRAWTTWSGCAGRTGCAVPGARGGMAGGLASGGGSALSAGAKRRSRRGRSSIALGRRSGCGLRLGGR
jgi:hypothetical protein